MYNIGIIMGGVMPVPAVCGGAIETLITSIVKRYSKKELGKVAKLHFKNTENI